MSDQTAANSDNPTELPDKFKGKSALEVYQSYLNLQKDYTEKTQQLGRISKFIDQIDPYFKTDDAGKVDWNFDILIPLAKQRGVDVAKIAGIPVVDKKKSQSTNDDGGDDMADDALTEFQKNPQQFLNNFVGQFLQSDAGKQIIESKAKELVDPISKTIKKDKATAVLTSMKEKYADFGDLQEEIIKHASDAGLDPNNAKALELIYHGVKGALGKTVDKEQSDQALEEYRNMLKESDTVLSAGGSLREQLETNPDEITGDSIFGIDTSKKKYNDDAVFEELTGQSRVAAK